MYDPILMAAAVIPAVYLMIYINKKDKLEKEPKAFLIRLAVMGMVSTLIASLAEGIGQGILNGIFRDTDSTLYNVILYFVVVGLVEEASKFLVLNRTSWDSPYFNCSFDAVIYSVFVSLGFALWENLKYVYTYGLGTALLRAVTAVPGHACFGVLMGAWFGLAKKCQLRGEIAKSERSKKLSVIIPALVHGAYDFFAGSGGIGTGIFVVLVFAMFAICKKMVDALSEIDTYIQ